MFQKKEEGEIITVVNSSCFKLPAWEPEKNKFVNDINFLLILLGVHFMIEVIDAKYEDEYRIWVHFNDGTKGIVDLKDELWGKIFEPLRDLKLFKKFKISELMNTIEWDNGADISPEFLYGKLT